MEKERCRENILALKICVPPWVSHFRETWVIGLLIGTTGVLMTAMPFPPDHQWESHGIKQTAAFVKVKNYLLRRPMSQRRSEPPIQANLLLEAWVQVPPCVPVSSPRWPMSVSILMPFVWLHLNHQPFVLKSSLHPHSPRPVTSLFLYYFFMMIHLQVTSGIFSALAGFPSLMLQL